MRRHVLIVLGLAAMLGLAGSCALRPLDVPVVPLLRVATAEKRLPPVEKDTPFTVIVRGWLMDGSSRGDLAEPTELFQPTVDQVLQSRYGVAAEFYDYEWSRLPKDVLSESVRFSRWADQLSDLAAAEGRCVNFVGHSAGAAFVYRAASQGTRMGFLGTLGLPTFGRGRPDHVSRWTNFFTSSHPDDIAGKLWADEMGADANVDLQQQHRDFWFAPEVAALSADGIGQAWSTCRV